jgi:hypothetical protein
MALISPPPAPGDVGLITRQSADTIWATVFAPGATVDASKRAESLARGEVFTPRSLVDEMLSKVPASLWADPNLKWFEPSAGRGQFALEVYRRLAIHHTHDHIVR